MSVKIIMNDNKYFYLKNIFIKDNNLIHIINYINNHKQTNYKCSDIIYLELYNCNNIKHIPKCCSKLYSIKIFNCKYINHIPKINSLKYIEFIKSNHKQKII